jgi:uncharacterized protein (TIGR02271 family)
MPRERPEPPSISLAQEQVRVSKREVETGRVRVSKRTETRRETVKARLRRQEVDVERVALDREVEGPLEPRYEGDCLVIPVVEEVLVVQKRWKLKEEIRLRTRSTQSDFRSEVSLRSEKATVRRKPRAIRPRQA